MIRDYDKLICLTGLWFDRFRPHNGSRILDDDKGEAYRAYTVHRNNELWLEHPQMSIMYEIDKRGGYDI